MPEGRIANTRRHTHIHAHTHTRTAFAAMSANAASVRERTMVASDVHVTSWRGGLGRKSVVKEGGIKGC